MVYTCILEYYSALKRKEILTHVVTTWTNLEDIFLGEIWKTQKDDIIGSHLNEAPKVVKFVDKVASWFLG